MIGWKLKALAGVSVFALVVSLGSWAHYERQERKSAEKSLEVAEERLAQSEKNREIEQSLQSAVSVIDKTQTQKLIEARNEISDLRGRVASGAVRLQLNAACPSAGLPKNSGDSSMGDGAAPRLEGAAQQAYFDLREGIERVTRQLSACQDILKQLKNGGPEGN